MDFDPAVVGCLDQGLLDIDQDRPGAPHDTTHVTWGLPGY